MKLKIAAIAFMMGALMCCGQSEGQLLDKMLNRDGAPAGYDSMTSNHDPFSQVSYATTATQAGCCDTCADPCADPCGRCGGGCGLLKGRDRGCGKARGGLRNRCRNTCPDPCADPCPPACPAPCADPCATPDCGGGLLSCKRRARRGCGDCCAPAPVCEPAPCGPACGDCGLTDGCRCKAGGGLLSKIFAGRGCGCRPCASDACCGPAPQPVVAPVVASCGDCGEPAAACCCRRHRTPRVRMARANRACCGGCGHVADDCCCQPVAAQPLPQPLPPVACGGCGEAANDCCCRRERRRPVRTALARVKNVPCCDGCGQDAVDCCCQPQPAPAMCDGCGEMPQACCCRRARRPARTANRVRVRRADCCGAPSAGDCCPAPVQVAQATPCCDPCSQPQRIGLIDRIRGRRTARGNNGCCDPCPNQCCDACGPISTGTGAPVYEVPMGQPTEIPGDVAPSTVNPDQGVNQNPIVDPSAFMHQRSNFSLTN